MRNVVVIPARGGSKRLKDKNIKVLDGVPLLVHSIIYAQKNSNCIDAVYVSTNDSVIRDIAIQYGAQVIDRPESLSDDFATTVSVLKHVLETVEEAIENVVVLQPTNPLRPENLLQEAMNLYKQGGYDSLFTVSRNHQKLGRIIDDVFVPHNYTIGQRSQDLEPLYFENGLLYICKAELILDLKIQGQKSFPLIVENPFAAVDIDTQADFDYAEYILNKSL
jgi:N-acylneuraminate cytidylyltransferase